jgi:molecular chaperone HscB
MSERQTYYQILGLAPRYRVELSELEERYHAQSKLFHPDRHVKADGPTRVKNALATSELNQAYRVLKDPVKRAEYLLELQGVKVAAEGPGAAKVAPAFLMEMMEQRETLAEARAEGNHEKVSELAAAMHKLRDAAMGELDDGFAKIERGDRSQLAGLTDWLVRLRYYRRFLDEIEAIEDARAEGAGP